jgi:hypothetical protein
MLCQSFFQLFIVPSQIHLILPLLIPLHLRHLPVHLDLFKFPLYLILAIPKQHSLHTLSLLNWLLLDWPVIMWWAVHWILRWPLLKSGHRILSGCLVFHRVEGMGETALDIGERVAFASDSHSGSISLGGIMVSSACRDSAKVVLMSGAILTWDWASTVTLMLFQVIFVFSLWHTIRAWKHPEALIIHNIRTKLTKIQRIYSMLLWFGSCNTKQISVDLRKSLSCVRHLAESFFRPYLSNRCINILKATRHSWVLLKRRVELAHKLGPIRW